MKLKPLTLFLAFSLFGCSPEEAKKPIVKPFSLSVVDANPSSCKVSDTLVFSIESNTRPTKATSFTIVSSLQGRIFINSSWQTSDSLSYLFSDNTTLLFVPLSYGTYDLKFSQDNEEIYSKSFSFSDKPHLSLNYAIPDIATGSFLWLPFTISDKSSSTSFEVISRINNIEHIDTIFSTNNIFKDSIMLSNDIAQNNSIDFTVKSMDTGESNFFGPYYFKSFVATAPTINFSYEYHYYYPNSDAMLESFVTNVTADGRYTAEITAKTGCRISRIERRTEEAFVLVFEYDSQNDVLSFTDRGEASENISYSLGFSLIQYEHIIDYNDDFHYVRRKNYDTYYGTKDTLTATLQVGYDFVGWFNKDGLKLSEANPYPYVMPAEDFYIEARASMDIQRVTFSAGAGGTVSNAGGNFEYGSKAEVIATPDYRYRFFAWYNGESEYSRNAKLSLTVLSSYNFVAVFEEDKYQILGSTPGGTVTGYGTYFKNDDVSMFVTVPVGDEFLGWKKGSSQIVSMDNPYNFKMPAENLTLSAVVREAPKRRITVGFESMDKYDASFAYVTHLYRDIKYYDDDFEEGKAYTLDLQNHHDGGYRFEWWMNGEKVGEGINHVCNVQGDMNYTVKIYTNWFDVNLTIGKATWAFGIDEPGDFGSAHISRDFNGNPVNTQSISAPYNKLIAITANSINDTKVINGFWRDGERVGGAGGSNINQTTNTDEIRVTVGTNNISILFAKKYHMRVGNRFSYPADATSERDATNAITGSTTCVVGEPMRVYANMNPGFVFEGWYNKRTGALISNENPFVKTYHEDEDIVFELRVK